MWLVGGKSQCCGPKIDHVVDKQGGYARFQAIIVIVRFSRFGLWWRQTANVRFCGYVELSVLVIIDFARRQDLVLNKTSSRELLQNGDDGPHAVVIVRGTPAPASRLLYPMLVLVRIMRTAHIAQFNARSRRDRGWNRPFEMRHGRRSLDHWVRAISNR